jgi:hypothetical protein
MVRVRACHETSVRDSPAARNCGASSEAPSKETSVQIPLHSFGQPEFFTIGIRHLSVDSAN